MIAGSATVSGSAFSVGASTFVVAGGSVTLGGRLNVASAGIKWADGTTSTTAATANIAVLSATQTFSGATAFTSTVTINSALVFSTFTYTIIDLAGATASGVSSRANGYTSCVSGSSISWIADGMSTYTVRGNIGGEISGGSPGTWAFGFFLDGNIPAGQTQTKGLCSSFMTTAEERNCPFEGEISPSAGLHTVCLAFGQTSYGDTLTFGGTAALKSAVQFILKIAR